MVTLLSVCPWLPWLGLTEVMLGGARLTVNAPVLVAVPPKVATDTSLVPGVAESIMVILAVIWVEVFTVKLLTVIPEPKLIDAAPFR